MTCAAYHRSIVRLPRASVVSPELVDETWASLNLALGSSWFKDLFLVKFWMCLVTIFKDTYWDQNGFNAQSYIEKKKKHFWKYVLDWLFFPKILFKIVILHNYEFFKEYPFEECLFWHFSGLAQFSVFWYHFIFILYLKFLPLLPDAYSWYEKFNFFLAISVKKITRKSCVNLDDTLQ